MGEDCGWEYPMAPAVRKLWREGATVAVLESLEDISVGRRLSSGGDESAQCGRGGRGRGVGG